MKDWQVKRLSARLPILHVISKCCHDIIRSRPCRLCFRVGPTPCYKQQAWFENLPSITLTRSL